MPSISQLKNRLKRKTLWRNHASHRKIKARVRRMVRKGGSLAVTHSSVHAEREMLDSLQILSANFPTDSTTNIQLIESDDENENLQVTNDRLPLPQPTVTTKPKQTLTNKLQPLTNRLQQPFTAKMKQRPQFCNPENQLLPIRQQSPLARIEKQPFTDSERLSSVVIDKNGLDKRQQLTFVSSDQHLLTANIQQLPLAKKQQQTTLEGNTKDIFD